MSIVNYQEEIVIADHDQTTARVPDWAALFRLICEHLREKGHLQRLEELVELDRRADSFKLIDIVLFFIAYYCAQPSQGGIREFWYEIRGYQDKIAAIAGRRKLPSSASVSRFLAEVDVQKVAGFGGFALGEGTDLGALGARNEAMWLDTQAEPWLFVDWDPKARLIRQRTLVEGEEYPEARRFGPNLGKPGQAGRKRGELKFVHGLLAHAGSGQWLGGYRQSGNGTLVDEIEEIKRVKKALDAQLKDDLINPPVMRIDGEGGEVPVINGVMEAGFVPLVRLKQYHLLDRSDVQRAIKDSEPTLSKGSGTGPVREVFEIGIIPLTSNRKVDELHRWDNPIEIRLVVSRYKQTDADQGGGKLIDGMRYEMFGTYLKARAWPCEAVVDAYFGRGTVENRYAGADRELDHKRIFCKKNPAGDHLVMLVGLWGWNLMIELGDKLVEREQIPAPPEREPTAAAKDSEVLNDLGCNEALKQDASSDCREMDAAVGRRLERIGMIYVQSQGVIKCAEGHYLVPKRAGKRDESHVIFRITGRPCRGCPFRAQCTRSTSADFQKEVSIPIDYVPEAVEIRQGQKLAPLGVKPTEKVEPGAQRIRRPGMLPAKRRHALRRTARLIELEVEVEKSERPCLCADAEEWRLHRRSRQRLTRQMRRRYYRLGQQDQVQIRWKRGVNLLRHLSEQV